MNQPTQSTDKSVEEIFDIFHKHQGWMANLHMEATVKEVITHQLRLAELRGRIDELKELIPHIDCEYDRRLVKDRRESWLPDLEAELHDLEEEGE